MLYQRFPGPWKRYADAAGGNSDARALLDHIALRYRTKDGFYERTGEEWIAQSVRAWQQEVPLSPRRFASAVKTLEAFGLIEILVEPLRGHYPAPITHIRLTVKGKELIAPKPRLGQTVEINSSKSDEPSLSDSHTKGLSTSTSELNTPSLAASAAREGDQEREDRRNTSATSSARKERTPRRDIQVAWSDAMRQHYPDIPFSGFFGAQWQAAERVAQAFGPEPLELVRSAVENWKSVQDHSRRLRRGEPADEPNIIGLAMYADQALQAYRSAQEAKEWNRRVEAELAERDALIRDRPRRRYEELSGKIEQLRQSLASTPQRIEAEVAAERFIYWKGKRRADGEADMRYLEREIREFEKLDAEFGPRESASLNISHPPADVIVA